ncbi:hypothetical protein [Sphaerisporangium sp. TRM90804]|uniref:hypothetical protein n=1 Tax=Sphaerisporangium sp. TRM90804 TaxID=3031113 RepID=UPI00244D1D78|nr:hypothetical protein [Sphaerisporangium sp. TRM90804]MDH2429464.1 hypothetical protein [Sphaerisporangium sp. TRM90804]
MEEPTVNLAPVSVETLLLRADASGRWSYRRVVTARRPGETPDAAARRVAGVTSEAVSAVVHSTSWRYEPDGGIVLTYAVCPDPEPGLAATVMSELRLARGGAPATPAPDVLEVENVVTHAIRHLAFLKKTDPVVCAVLRQTPEIAKALDLASPSTAAEMTARAS